MRVFCWSNPRFNPRSQPNLGRASPGLERQIQIRMAECCRCNIEDRFEIPIVLLSSLALRRTTPATCAWNTHDRDATGRAGELSGKKEERGETENEVCTFA